MRFWAGFCSSSLPALLHLLPGTAGSSALGPDLQSMSSAWPSLPITDMSWSMIPQGMLANVCSPFWHTSALATKSPSSVPEQRDAGEHLWDLCPLPWSRGSKHEGNGLLSYGAGFCPRNGGARTGCCRTRAELLEQGVGSHLQSG